MSVCDICPTDECTRLTSGSCWWERKKLEQTESRQGEYIQGSRIGGGSENYKELESCGNK
jgi:hypothetical protein